jgi:hypothetical protein
MTWKGTKKMSLRFETFTCVECSKPFIKPVGGVIMSPQEMDIRLHPVCDQCKIRRLKSAFKNFGCK